MNTVNSFNEMLGIPASGQPAPRGSNELGQADFLELMVAQLKNQDPTKPMDNSEFLSQMAQFSMVNGIEGLNTSFSSVSESILGSQGLQAATLLDRQALVDSPWGHFDGVTSVAALSTVRPVRLSLKFKFVMPRERWFVQWRWHPMVRTDWILSGTA